jgi:predicted lysophospholipase L1 biosynthesis ABC-type transport system permease subunit
MSVLRILPFVARPPRIPIGELPYRHQALAWIGIACGSLVGFVVASVAYLIAESAGFYPSVASDGSGFVALAMLLVAIYPLVVSAKDFARSRAVAYWRRQDRETVIDVGKRRYVFGGKSPSS